MKKNLFFYVFAVLCTMPFFTSCSDDDDPVETVSAADSVIGDYQGNLSIALVTDGGFLFLRGMLFHRPYRLRKQETMQ